MVLNNRPYPDWHEGLTIRGVMEHMKFTWPKLVVKVNGQLIWPEDYDKVTLEEADDLKIYHLLGAGESERRRRFGDRPSTLKKK